VLRKLVRRALTATPRADQLLFLRGAVSGHFYSPIPSMDEVRADRDRIFAVPRDVPGVDLREDDQLQLMETFARDYYTSQPFREAQTDGLTYYFNNDGFAHADAITLHCMLRYLRPKRLIEIGSGFSSCVTLDTNRLFLDDAVRCTFIDPYPGLLRRLRSHDYGQLDVVPKRAQDVDVALFGELQSGDVLFIDSSHVVKVGSDVNHIVFNVLPSLAPGVRVHFHDVAYPFEYPEEWVLNGRSWSEAYLLHAFLMFNAAYAIELFPSYLIRFHRDFFATTMPLYLRDPGGSLWLTRAA
jgi:hypothetical protein